MNGFSGPTSCFPRLGVTSGKTDAVLRSAKFHYDIEEEWVTEFPQLRSEDDWNKIRSLDGLFEVYKPNKDIENFGPSNPPTHRSVTVFENELEHMTEESVPLLMELLDGDVSVTEMPYASKYRTDVVICDIDWESLTERIEITGTANALNEEWKYLKSYRYIKRENPIRKSEFIDGRVPYVEQTSKQVWNWLEENNILAKTSRGYYTVVDLPIHVTAHAVELKQRDWKEALEQVRRATRPYKYCADENFSVRRQPEKYGYADYQYVGIDAGQLPKIIDHLDVFKQAGVGLVGIEENGAVLLVQPEKKTPPEGSLDRRHINEKSIEKLDVSEEIGNGKIRSTENDDETSSERNVIQTGLEGFEQ